MNSTKIDNKLCKGEWKGYFCDFDDDDPSCTTIIIKFSLTSFDLVSFNGNG